MYNGNKSIEALILERDKPLPGKFPDRSDDFSKGSFVQMNHSPQQKRHVLIVDDEPAVRHTVRGALESSGFDCAESENGASAIEWLKEHHTDVIIADYQMPIMNGLSLLEKVQSTLNGHTPRVIMLSGIIEEKEKLKAIDLGAYAIIDKPCNFRELVLKVNEAITP
jgi:DNA-binding response OmpR family regulator